MRVVEVEEYFSLSSSTPFFRSEATLFLLVRNFLKMGGEGPLGLNVQQKEENVFVLYKCSDICKNTFKKTLKTKEASCKNVL